MTKKIEEYDDLSVAERILVLQDLWDDIAEQPDSVPVTRSQRNELDARLARHRANPAGTMGWDEARARVKGEK